MDLAFDVERTDRYGRTLAGVYANGVLVNAQLASEGLAVPATVGSNTRFRAEVDASWQAADDKRLGLFDPTAPCTAPGQVQTLKKDVANLATSPAPQTASDAAAAALVAKTVTEDASTLQNYLVAKSASEVAALPQRVLSPLVHEVAGLASQSAATYNALLKTEGSLKAQEKARADAKARAEAAARAKAKAAAQAKAKAAARAKAKAAARAKAKAKARAEAKAKARAKPRQRRSATSPQTRMTPRAAAARARTPATQGPAVTRRAARHGGLANRRVVPTRRRRWSRRRRTTTICPQSGF